MGKFFLTLIKIILWPFKFLFKLFFKLVKRIMLLPFRFVINILLLVGFVALLVIIFL